MSTWLDVLRQAVKSSSLAVMAKRLGISRTTISQVCNQKYPGDLARIQRLVESVLMAREVECPILGSIPLHQCRAHQQRKSSEVGSRPDAIKLWRACRSGCPNSELGEEKSLRRPMRLPVTVIEPDPEPPRYDSEAVISRMRRQSKSDSDNLSTQMRILNTLLEEELRTLAIKYNRLLRGR
ncbi:transcriptional regulator [Aeromonas sp. R9-1]|uniref:transcriptional regulator n=1 Tax=Aeromonas sp. R9-1 TaxID=3138478 RepID=UPI0034A2C283